MPFDDLTVIVPAHNEALRIRGRIEGLCERLPGAEVIVVANNCSDETGAIVVEMMARYRDLRLVTVPFVIGKGGAVRVGFQMAKRDIVAFVDADESTSPAELARLTGQLGDADCLIASRWLPGSDVFPRQNAFRRIASRAFNLLVQAFTGIRFSDTQCGAKILRRRAFERVAEFVETADFAFDVDLLFQLQRLGFSIREVPTVWSDCIGSSLRASTAIPRMFGSLVRLRLRHSPLRIAVPAIDRILNLKPISTRRSLRILVLSNHAPSDRRASAAERRFGELASELSGYGRSFTWHARGGAHVPSMAARASSLGAWPLPLRYVLGLRDRFDCVIEIADTGYLWSPLFCLKPTIVYRDSKKPLPLPYRNVARLERLPESAVELDHAILATSRKQQDFIIRRGDGSWYVTDATRSEELGSLEGATDASARVPLA